MWNPNEDRMLDRLTERKKVRHSKQTSHITTPVVKKVAIRKLVELEQPKPKQKPPEPKPDLPFWERPQNQKLLNKALENSKKQGFYIKVLKEKLNKYNKEHPDKPEVLPPEIKAKEKKPLATEKIRKILKNLRKIASQKDKFQTAITEIEKKYNCEDMGKWLEENKDSLPKNDHGLHMYELLTRAKKAPGKIKFYEKILAEREKKERKKKEESQESGGSVPAKQVKKVSSSALSTSQEDASKESQESGGSAPAEQVKKVSSPALSTLQEDASKESQASGGSAPAEQVKKVSSPALSTLQEDASKESQASGGSVPAEQVEKSSSLALSTSQEDASKESQASGGSVPAEQVEKSSSPALSTSQEDASKESAPVAEQVEKSSSPALSTSQEDADKESQASGKSTCEASGKI